MTIQAKHNMCTLCGSNSNCNMNSHTKIWFFIFFIEGNPTSTWWRGYYHNCQAPTTRSRLCKDMFLAMLLWRLFRWVELESSFSPQQPLSYHHGQGSPLLETFVSSMHVSPWIVNKFHPTPILWHPSSQSISKPFTKWCKSTKDYTTLSYWHWLSFGRHVLPQLLKNTMFHPRGERRGLTPYDNPH
jgi:hypothetical protein